MSEIRKSHHKENINRLNEVYRYVLWHFHKYGIAPSVRDIMEHTGITSTSMAAYYINKLVMRGYLVKYDGLSRGLALTEKARKSELWTDLTSRNGQT